MIRAVFSHPALLIPATLLAFALLCGEIAVLHPGMPLLLGGSSVLATAARIGSGLAAPGDQPIADLIGPLMIFVLQLLAVATILALLWRLVRNPVRLWRIRHRGGHLLLMGDASLAPIIAGEARTGNPAIVLTRHASPRWHRWLHETGSPHLPQGDGNGLGRYLKRARLALIAGPSDDENIALADTMLRGRDDLAARAVALPMIVRVDDIARHTEAERVLAAGGSADAVHVRLVSLPGLIGRSLLRSNLIDRIERVGSPRRLVVVIGLTPVTERYVLDLLIGAHFSDGRDPLMVIVDPAPAMREAAFVARWPSSLDLELPSFVAGDLTDPGALTEAVLRVSVPHGLPATVLIDLPDESVAIAAMTAIDQAMRERDAVAPLYAVHASAAALSSAPVAAVPFGGADVARYGELLLYERQEAIARAVHEFALEGWLEDGTPLGARPEANGWDALPEWVRDDHRLLVDLYLLKLRDIGARIVPGRHASSRFEPEELNELIRAEHHRRTAAGRWADHPAIGAAEGDVALGASSEAGAFAQEREQIGIVTRLLARAGQRVVRDLPVLLEPGHGADLAAAIDALARAYPDRVPVFLGDMAEGSVRAALETAHRLGHPIQIAMAQHVEVLADSLVPHEAARCRMLAAAAEHVIALPPGADASALLAARAHHRLAGRDATLHSQRRAATIAA